jgi:hypothetical protein
MLLCSALWRVWRSVALGFSSSAWSYKMPCSKWRAQ